ncbi:hypothetical protein DM860_004137 [Cuscuta australis]|uniref:Prolyl endopeptidase n=1 Tax=Cuscuta australis TaxID=267555 RepID=A0A328CVE2_9ASTE|nr:hypothetical protein DM860_004137 [Cuscuta australis]
MRYLLAAFRRNPRRHKCIPHPINCTPIAYYRPQKPLPAPSPPSPPKPPKKPANFTLHGESWEDPYNWMSQLNDKVAMRHMDVYMEQEEKYTEAVMSDTERLQSKLQSEMASRMANDLSTPPLRWGPWLYYRRVEEGKQYPVLCRRLASTNAEFISHVSPSSGFDFTSGKRIEQKLLDYNQEAERFGGYAYEELSEISPDHRYLAYTMYDKENDLFKLSVRDLNLGSPCNKPQADHVTSIAWAMNGQALLYVVTDHQKPYRLYCNMLGTGKDVLLFEEPSTSVNMHIRHTKDFLFVTVNVLASTSSKVFLIDGSEPLSGLKLVWESEGLANCIVEHHHGYLYMFTNAAKNGKPVDSYYLLHAPVKYPLDQKTWENVLVDDSEVIEDVDFSSTHMVLVVREGRTYKLCSVPLPLPSGKLGVRLQELNPQFLPLPGNVCQILPGPNYDFCSSTMRFTILSPVMPDAVVDYNLSTGSWNIVQQQNMFYERTRSLYGSDSFSDEMSSTICLSKVVGAENHHPWNDLSEIYACEHYDVTSYDGVAVPLTVIYSRSRKKQAQNPGLLHGHGAYGEILDKRWRTELKSLLDRGWVIAYADVRGGGGGGRKWHEDGKCSKKVNSIHDYIACAKYLIDAEIVEDTKLAGWGYSAGGLLVASAINSNPNLFRAAILKVPFLDPSNTLNSPILPLTPADYEEFGYPGDIEDFRGIRKYSPYDNIQKDAHYPAVLVTSSFNTRFGAWEAAKWVARVREYAIYDPKRLVLLNLTVELVEENRYLHCKELALELAFLIKMME